jgi:hypothetical protein
MRDEGLASFQSLGLGRPTECYAYSFLCFNTYTTETVVFLRASHCVIVLKDGIKLICFAVLQQYFIYLIGYQFRPSDRHQALIT